MSLHDYFFPIRAQSLQLRRLADQSASARRQARRRGADAEAVRDRVEALEQDLGYVALVLGALVSRLDEDGVVTKADLKAIVAQLDDIDGVKDGRLDITALRAMPGGD